VNLGHLSLVLAFLMLALLAWVVVRHSRWHWGVRACAAGAVVALAFVTYRSYPALLGWPSAAELPERFTLVGAHVEEPNKTTQTRGAIYLWVRDLLAAVDAPPRAYLLPYTAGLHAKVVAAEVKLRKGLPQLGERSSATDGASDPLDFGKADVTVEFFDMPDPLFPER
jgi:hypothetical protein